MTDREAIELISPETGLSKMAEIEYYHGFEGLDAVRKALSDAYALAVSALQERIDREKGCERCQIFENDPQFLFSRGNGQYDEIMFKYCPVCGCKLKKAMPGEEV